MDVFFTYLLVSSTTPLFLWKERRTLAILHIPVIAAMWGIFLTYINFDLGLIGHFLFGVSFVVNVVIAHLTIYHVFAKPFFTKKMRDIRNY
ncbi:spore morphogenesis/germination protein YwcE [Metabacillus sp. Hm71]|uniref:spore morphogenesis/germination protein YwcE n=1 Tax=Metabacillus sp. Hm71 TaxID=3450743 RepID=UPI003F435E0F